MTMYHEENLHGHPGLGLEVPDNDISMVCCTSALGYITKSATF